MVDSSPPSGAVAFGLGLLAPGLGHWYAGRIRAAASFVIAFGVALPALVFACAALGIYAGIWGLVAGVWLLHLVSALHAAWAVRPAQKHAVVAGHSTLGYLGFAAVSLGLGTVGRYAIETYAFESFSTPSESMLPTLQPGDDFTVAKLRARDREAVRGDLVVFAPPNDPSVRFMKRVLGLPGETLTFPAQQPPTVDGVAMQWSPCESQSPRHQCWVETTPSGAQYMIYLMTSAEPRTDPPAIVPIEVPPGHVFLVGDNRQESADSRTAFGPVPVADIEGRAVNRYLPWSRRGSLIPSE